MNQICTVQIEALFAAAKNHQHSDPSSLEQLGSGRVGLPLRKTGCTSSLTRDDGSRAESCPTFYLNCLRTPTSHR
ncbi:hypothetical protein VTN02DRAFT_3548 [Thermoascus thermophilus]